MRGTLLRPRQSGAALTGVMSSVLDRAFPPDRRRRTFVEWVEDKAKRGFSVDGKPFTWDGFGPLKSVYQAISESQVTDLIKSAQGGATVMELASILWRAEEWPGTSHGFYFPTRGDVSELSKIRFRPMLEQLGVGVSDGSTSVKTTMVVQSGSSPIYMRYMEGRVSKDSIPLDSITFDEVRLMNDADIDQVEVRVEGSPHKWILACSTAGYPDCDIDRRFKLGTMHRWLTKCAACGVSVCLALEWPRCIAVTSQEPLEARYVCTRCGRDIDPLAGEWVAEQPGRARRSYHLHSMLRRYNSASRLWEIWTKTRNVGEFHRAYLGLPYLDAASVPLSVEQLRANNVDRELRWQERAKSQDSYLGADQRGGELHVVVTGAHPSRSDHEAARHVEVIQNEDPWVRLGELMEVHRVDVAVVDALPSKNESIRFAKRFPGRVFVSYYDTDPKTADVAKWLDRAKESVFVRKADEESKYKYTVRIARYLAIGWALEKLQKGRFLFPEPEALRQPLRAHGKTEHTSVVDSHHEQLSRLTLFRHLCSVAREVEVDEDTAQVTRVRWVNLGLDPHFLHAYTYACVAASRSGARPTFLRGDEPANPLERLVVGPIVPDQAEALADLVASHGGGAPPLRGHLCGNCRNWRPHAEGTKGDCRALGFVVDRTELPCEQWTPAPTEE